MKEILSRCGFRCDLCLAYRENIGKHPENKQKLSDGWYKYFGFRIPADEIYCEGCIDNPTLDKDCRVRPCVIEKGLQNCSQCDSYVCEKLKERIFTYEDVRQKFGEEIPEEDYVCFIKPYENKKRLDALRKKQPGL